MPDAGADATHVAATLPGWMRSQLSLAGGVYFPVRGLTNNASWIWQLRLPQGSVLRRVRALVRPGTSRASAGDRMSLRLWTNELRFATGGGPAVGTASAEARDDGAVATQVLDVGALRVAIDNPSRVYFARVHAGNPTASDLVFALEVTWVESGPRND